MSHCSDLTVCFCPQGLMCHGESNHGPSSLVRVTCASLIARRPHLSFTLSPGHLDLFEHLRPLLHHQGLLVGVG